MISHINQQEKYVKIINDDLISSVSNKKNFTDIKEINLSSKNEEEKIKKIENLDSLKSLKLLNLSYNSISRIENLINLTELTEIDLSNNFITSFDGLNCLKNLKILNLNTNRIVSIPKSLSNICPNLKILNIENNLISSYISVTNISELEFLQDLNLLKNPIFKLNNSRLYTIYNIKSLQILNNIPISKNELAQAEKQFKIDFNNSCSASSNKSKNKIQKITNYVHDIEAQIQSKNKILEQQSRKLSNVIKTQKDLEEKLEFYVANYTEHSNDFSLAEVNDNKKEITTILDNNKSANYSMDIEMKNQLLDSLEILLKEKSLAIKKSNEELYDLKNELSNVRNQIFQVSNELVKFSDTCINSQYKETSNEIKEKKALIDELNEINRKLNIGLENCEKQIKSDENELKELKDQYKEGNSSDKSFEKINEIEINLNHLYKSKEEIECNLIKVFDKIQQETNEISELEAILETKNEPKLEEIYEKELETIINHLQNFIKNLETQVQEKDLANDKLIDVNNQLMQTLINFEKNLSEINIKMYKNEDLEKTIESLLEDNKRLNNLVKKIKNEYSHTNSKNIENSDIETIKLDPENSLLVETNVKNNNKCSYDNNSLRKLELINNMLQIQEEENKYAAVEIEKKLSEYLGNPHSENKIIDFNNNALKHPDSTNSVSYAHSESINASNCSESDSHSVSDILLQKLAEELEKLKKRIKHSSKNREILVQLMNDEIKYMNEKINELQNVKKIEMSNLDKITTEKDRLKEQNVEINLKNYNLIEIIKEKDKMIDEKEIQNKRNEDILYEKNQRIGEMSTVLEELTNFRNDFLEIMNLNDFNFINMITENMDVKEAGSKTKIYSIVINFYKRMQEKIQFCNIPEHENKVKEFENFVKDIETNKAEYLKIESIVDEKNRLTNELDQLNKLIDLKKKDLNLIEIDITKNISVVKNQENELEKINSQKINEQNKIENLISKGEKIRNQNKDSNRMIHLAMVELNKQKNELEENKERIASEHEKLKKITEILKLKNNEYNDLSNECELLENTISNLKNESKTISDFAIANYNNTDKLDKLILERSIILKDLESKISNEEEIFRSIKQNKISIEHEYDLVAAQHEDRFSQLQKAITEAEIKLDNKKSELEKLTNQTTHVLHEYNEIVDKSFSEEKHLDEIRKKIIKNEKELEDLSSEKHRYSSEINNFINEKDAELQILDNIKSHQSRLIKENENLNNINKEDQCLKNKKSNKSNHKVSFENERKELNELESLTNKKREDLTTIIDKFEYYQNTILELEEKFKLTNSEVQNLTEKKIILMEEFKQIENECNELKTIKNNYVTEIENMEEQITEGRKMYDEISFEYQKYHQELENIFNEIYVKSCELDEITKSINEFKNQMFEENEKMQQLKDESEFAEKYKIMINDMNCLVLRIERLEYELQNKNKENNELQGLLEMKNEKGLNYYNNHKPENCSLNSNNNFRNKVFDTITDCELSFESSQQNLINDLQRIRQKILNLENIFANNEDNSRIRSMSNSQSRSSSHKRPTRDIVK